MPRKKTGDPLVLRPREVNALRILAEGGKLLEERSTVTGKKLPGRKSFYKVQPAKGIGGSLELEQGEGNRLIAYGLVMCEEGHESDFAPTRFISDSGIDYLANLDKEA